MRMHSSVTCKNILILFEHNLELKTWRCVCRWHRRCRFKLKTTDVIFSQLIGDEEPNRMTRRREAKNKYRWSKEMNWLWSVWEIDGMLAITHKQTESRESHPNTNGRNKLDRDRSVADRSVRRDFACDFTCNTGARVCVCECPVSQTC